MLFCAFQPDHYDNKLQSYLTLARACFYRGKISRKTSSLLSVICSMRSLDVRGSVQKKKMKLHETVGNESSSVRAFWSASFVFPDGPGASTIARLMLVNFFAKTKTNIGNLPLSRWKTIKIFKTVKF